MNANAFQVLTALRTQHESTDDGIWGIVYLDNCRLGGMSDKVFRAALATLAKQGFYKVVDGFAWGSVLLERKD